MNGCWGAIARARGRTFAEKLAPTIRPDPRAVANRCKDAVNATKLMKLTTLEDLFQHELKDLYSAENQLVKALPKMAKAASHEELKAGFTEHLQQTKVHVERLQEIGKSLGVSLTGHKCKAMEGIVEEGSDLISEDAEDTVRDVGLIGAAQRVEHYEISAYGTARVIALHLGYEDVANLLGETLQEEKMTDQKLTQLAETAINAEAPRAGR